MISALYIGQNTALKQALTTAVDQVQHLEHSVELLANRHVLASVQLVVVEKDIKGTPLTCLRELTTSNGLDSNTPILVVGESFSQEEKVALLRSGISELAQPSSKLVDAVRQLLSITPNTLTVNHQEIDTIGIAKRAFDIAFASFCLIMLSPVMLTIALLIKLDSRGPLVYKSKRVGRAYQVFDFLKFRTMKVNADSLVKDMATENQYANEETESLETSSNEFLIDAMGNTIDEETFLATQKADKGGAFFKVKNDPRITRIGRFLRATSLDELPQFINVLFGDMSIVGPRPPVPKEVKQYRNWQMRRLSVKPGITCIWQVSGRNQIGFEDWVRMDLRYIDHWNVWLDLQLILKTFKVVFIRPDGA